MTNSQQKFLASLEANIEAAKAVGLLASVEVEDHDYFISARVKVEFDLANIETKRNGHYMEFYAALMIGKRGGIDGTCKTGSVFTNTRYQKGTYGGESMPRIFSMIVQDGCEYGIQDMIETAQNMAHLDSRGAA